MRLNLKPDVLVAALSNGAYAEVDMKIGTEWYSDDVSYSDELNASVARDSEPLVKRYKGWRGGRIHTSEPNEIYPFMLFIPLRCWASG